MLSIRFKYSICFVIFLVLVFNQELCFGQIVQNMRNPYHLRMTQSVKDYKSLVAANPDMQMIDLAKKIPSIVLDIRYATANNFTGKVIYASSKAFVRNPVANAIQEVYALNGQFFSILINSYKNPVFILLNVISLPFPSVHFQNCLLQQF